MSFTSRLFSGFLLFAALLAILASMSIERLAEWYAPRDSFGNRISLLAEQRKRERLERALQATQERENNKEIVVEELINGEMNLFEAAAWFRLIHEAPQSWPDPCHPRPRHDDGERWCRLVINYTSNRVRYEQSASQADVLRQRWETALHEQLDHHGGVKLPG